MAMLTKPSAAAKMALAYITIGSLMLVWTGVWYAYLYRHPAPNEYTYYLCTALLLTGGTLLVIGLGVGHIGRAARRAEMPPPETMPTVAQTDQVAAATGGPSPQNVQPGAPAASTNPVATPAQPVQAVPVAPRPIAAGTPFTPGR
jgi:hypothetical protein